MAFHKAANDFTVTLNGAIGGSDVSITVTGDLSPISSILPVYLTIESEIIEVTNVVSQVMTCVRGTQGTTGSPHADASEVALNITAYQINELIDDKQDADAAPVFGTNYNYTTKVGDESTVSTLPTLYHSFTTPTLPAGSYLLTVYSIQSGGSTSQSSFREVTLDSIRIGYEQSEPKDANNQEAWNYITQFTVPSAASVTIELNYGKVSGAAATILKESKIILWRAF